MGGEVRCCGEGGVEVRQGGGGGDGEVIWEAGDWFAWSVLAGLGWERTEVWGWGCGTSWLDNEVYGWG